MAEARRQKVSKAGQLEGRNKNQVDGCLVNGEKFVHFSGNKGQVT
jgi:hypothetical protein